MSLHFETIPSEPMLLLVNLNYADSEQGNIIYEVPMDKVDNASKAIMAGKNDWDNHPASSGTIEDYIDTKLKAAGIMPVSRNYSIIDLNMNC